MDSINTQLEVLETCSALPRQHTSLATVVTTVLPTSGIAMDVADLSVEFHGNGAPFGVVRSMTPSERHYGPSGLTAWSPPV